VTGTVRLTGYLMARISDERDDLDWLCVGDQRRQVVTAGDRHVLKLRGLMYLDHGDYRYAWLRD